MRRLFLIAALALAATLTTSARAGDNIKPAITVGLAEVVGISSDPAHLGLYITNSLDVGFVINDKWMLITSSGFEFAPENGHWGLTQFFILDRLIKEVGDVAITLEPQIGFIHDAAPLPDGGVEHAFFPSAGLGVAFVTKRGTWIPQVIGSVGTKGEGWTIAPTLLYSVGF